MEKLAIEKLSLIAGILEKEGKKEAKRIAMSPAFAQASSVETLRQIVSNKHDTNSKTIFSALDRGLNVIGVWEERYPRALKDSPDPPSILYVHGQLPKPEPMIAIVGSRAADLSAWRFAAKLSKDLAAAGVIVVSGLAKGIDGAAHNGALESGKPCATIGVLAHGLDIVYPRAHEKLAQAMVSNGGALLSEYPPGTPPFKHQFLERNRIVAALGAATVVIQAGERSGALVTAREALDAGKDLYVSPGPPDEARYAGSHKLLKTGAYVITGVDDLLPLFPGLEQRKQDAKKMLEYTQQERVLLTYLKREKTVCLSALPDATKLSQQEIMLALSSLELAGVIEILPGDRLILSGV